MGEGCRKIQLIWYLISQSSIISLSCNIIICLVWEVLYRYSSDEGRKLCSQGFRDLADIYMICTEPLWDVYYLKYVWHYYDFYTSFVVITCLLGTDAAQPRHQKNKRERFIWFASTKALTPRPHPFLDSSEYPKRSSGLKRPPKKAAERTKKMNPSL